MAADATVQGTGLQRRGDGTTAVPTGGSLDIESGAEFKIAGTAIARTAAEINDGVAVGNVARTATTAGATTGTIAAAGRIQVVVVTATDANHIIILPAPVVGTIIVLVEASTVGYELRTSAPTTIGINGGAGADAESAIPASTTVILVCETLTNWKGLQLSSTAGTLAKVEVAA